jgi:hypothetical protein
MFKGSSQEKGSVEFTYCSFNKTRQASSIHITQGTVAYKILDCLYPDVKQCFSPYGKHPAAQRNREDKKINKVISVVVP